MRTTLSCILWPQNKSFPSFSSTVRASSPILRKPSLPTIRVCESRHHSGSFHCPKQILQVENVGKDPPDGSWGLKNTVPRALGRRMLLAEIPFSSPHISPISALPAPQPLARSALWPVDGAAQSPAPSPRLPRLAASWPRCTTLRLSSSVYSFQILSCCFFFGSLFCVMVFQLFFHSFPHPPTVPPLQDS